MFKMKRLVTCSVEHLVAIGIWKAVKASLEGDNKSPEKAKDSVTSYPQSNTDISENFLEFR